MFQLTAARRRLPAVGAIDNAARRGFNSQPLEGGCVLRPALLPFRRGFNSQPLEGGCYSFFAVVINALVSTHSRSKAAANVIRVLIARRYSFNSQPLEGGCHEVPRHIDPRKAFQLTAARRRLLARPAKPRHARVFQLTAARRRLRGFRFWGSRGGWVSTHSRSKAAALSDVISIRPNQAFQLTAARRRLLVIAPLQIRLCRFQLTAARRRLPPWSVSFRWGHYVSTHSRSKAAAGSSAAWAARR